MKRKLPIVSKHLHIFICFSPKLLFRILPWRYSWRSQDVSRLIRRKRFNFRSYSYVLKIRKIHGSNRVQLDIQTSVSPKLEAWFISRNVQLETSNSWKKILLMNFSDSHLHQKFEVLKIPGKANVSWCLFLNSSLRVHTVPNSSVKVPVRNSTLVSGKSFFVFATMILESKCWLPRFSGK